MSLVSTCLAASVGSARNTSIAGHTNSLWMHYDLSDGAQAIDRSSVSSWLREMILDQSLTYTEQVNAGFEFEWTFPPTPNSTNNVNSFSGDRPTFAGGGFSPSWSALQAGFDATGSGGDVVFNTDNFNMGYIAPMNYEPDETGSQVVTGGAAYSTAIAGHIDTYEANLSGTIRYWIFSGLPKMHEPVYTAYPISGANLTSWKTHSKTTWRTWQSDLVNAIRLIRPSLDVGLIDGQIFNDVWDNVSGVSSMGVADFFFDDAPHGRADVYCILAAITYSTFYGIEAPDLSSSLVAAGVDSRVSSNWGAITSYVNTQVNGA